MPASRRLLAAFALSALAGCGDRAPAPAPSPTPTAGYSQDPASGEIVARIAPHGEPAATLRSGPGVPARLPRGFALYPGSKIASSTVVERGGREWSLLVFTSPDPLEQVTGHYRALAVRAGAKLTLDLAGEERASLGGVLPSGRDFTFAARREGALTRVELSFD